MPPRKKARVQAPFTSSQPARRAASPERVLAAEPPVHRDKAPLPADLAYIIVAHVVGDYFQDIILDPENASNGDVIGTMLHVSRAFREFTMKFLRMLWGITFFNGTKLTNYKPAVSILRELVTAPYREPYKFIERVNIPVLNSRVIRRRSGIFMDLALFLLDRVACKIMAYQGNRPFGADMFQPGTVSMLRKSYHDAMPSMLRPLLLGRMWDEVVKWAIIWQRTPHIEKTFWSVLGVASSVFGPRAVAILCNSNAPKDTYPNLGPVPDDLEPELVTVLEEAREGKRFCDEVLAELQREDDFHRLPPITLQEFPLERLTFTALPFFERAEVQTQHYTKVVRIARKCIGMFLSEDEEARFVGEPEASQKTET